MQTRFDLTGQRFKRLLVTGPAPCRNGRAAWFCVCDCGKEVTARTGDLQSGRHGSCGCLHREVITKHGHAVVGHQTSEYSTWLSMIQRCTNPNAPHYERYGGRGIKVCDAWLNSFQNFLSDMSPKSTPKHTLERVDNDGNYELANCR